jgi:Uma2 family endonuclease
MATPQAQIFFTEEQYLAIERQSVERHEYIDGRIRAMAGESDEHGEIAGNIFGHLFAKLRSTPCRARHENTKVRSGPEPPLGQNLENFYSYPDVLVVCGTRQFHDQYRDVLLNPNLIFEVLSRSTEAFDRGEKFIRYRTWLPTLTDYLLVHQTKPFIEHYHRQPNNQWLLVTIAGLESELHLASINCTLKLSDVYEGVTFKPSLALLTEQESSGNESPHS